MVNTLRNAPRHPPNQTKWGHIQTHGSVDKKHVLRDVRNLCLCLLQLIQLKKVPFSYLINNALYHTVIDCYFFSRLKIEHMMPSDSYAYILELGADVIL
jgi:hypothetical protein